MEKIKIVRISDNNSTEFFDIEEPILNLFKPDQNGVYMSSFVVSMADSDITKFMKSNKPHLVAVQYSPNVEQ